jgi:hypothetical protein
VKVCFSSVPLFFLSPLRSVAPPSHDPIPRETRKRQCTDACKITTGKLNKFLYWPLDCVLHYKYFFPKEEADAIAAFLTPTLPLPR